MTTDKFVRQIYELHNDAGNTSAVDDAYDAAIASLKESDLIVACDDRAENLVTAITRFVLESGNSFLA